MILIHVLWVEMKKYYDKKYKERKEIEGTIERLVQLDVVLFYREDKNGDLIRQKEFFYSLERVVCW